MVMGQFHPIPIPNPSAANDSAYLYSPSALPDSEMNNPFPTNENQSETKSMIGLHVDGQSQSSSEQLESNSTQSIDETQEQGGRSGAATSSYSASILAVGAVVADKYANMKFWWN